MVTSCLAFVAKWRLQGAKKTARTLPSQDFQHNIGANTKGKMRYIWNTRIDFDPLAPIRIVRIDVVDLLRRFRGVVSHPIERECDSSSGQHKNVMQVSAVLLIGCIVRKERL